MGTTKGNWVYVGWSQAKENTKKRSDNMSKVKWTDEVIVQEIKEVIEELKLDKMPTLSQIATVKGKNFSVTIGNHGGLTKFAKELGYKVRVYTNIEEIYKEFEKFDRKRDAIISVCKKYDLKESTAKTYHGNWSAAGRIPIKTKLIEYLNQNNLDGTNTEIVEEILKNFEIPRSTAFAYLGEYRKIKEKEKEKAKKKQNILFKGRARQKFLFDDSKLWR